ncbi:MAG: hypothetical protein HYS27_02360 [Deltaproteobacteria bacterium]|nr:hypothetical protein [Deltaproteobacteria bacterium]
MRPQETIQAFDVFLAARGLKLDAVVVGGAALALLGVITRETRDCDVMVPELPAQILDAARAFAAEVRGRGDVLRDDWLNNGPADVAKVLPPGWEARLQQAFFGSALVLRTLGRADLLKTKLFALCDRGQDIGDCLALAPTVEELREALAWVQDQDANTMWPEHVEATLADLGRRLGHGV